MADSSGRTRFAAQHSRRMWLKIAAGVLAISVFALAAVVVYRWHRQQRPQEQAALTAVPFTALPGQATSPAFSPDGSRIAFAWNGDPKGGAKGFDLYVKALGSETLLRLTQHPSEWISPAWSPDGTQIAFHRMAGADTGIYVVPALGGPERKLRSTRMPWRSCYCRSLLSVGRRTASGSPSPMYCQKRNMQGSISSPRKHWRPSRFQSVQSALVKGCQRSPTAASTSHTGVFEARRRAGPVFLTTSGWSAENDFAISGFSRMG